MADTSAVLSSAEVGSGVLNVSKVVDESELVVGALVVRHTPRKVVQA